MIPLRHMTLQMIAISEALFGLILSRLTMKPPQTIPIHAPGMATPPEQKIY